MHAETRRVDEDLWTRIDGFIEQQLVPHDPALGVVVESSAAAGLPPIAVSPAQGKMLYLLARLAHARRVLEIGTLGGYSTIWLARGLEPGGRLVTLEVDPAHAAIARDNLARAGLAAIVEVRVGAALETLANMANEGAAPFDLVFVDADKANNPLYIEWAVRLGRPGTLIIVDNVVRQGFVLDADSADAAIIGTRHAYALVARHPRLSATAIQTVGTKGHDGFLMALITDTAT